MKKPWYKKWWVWAIVIFVLFIAMTGNDDEIEQTQNDTAVEDSEAADEAEDPVSEEETAEIEEPDEPVEETPQRAMVNKIVQLIETGQVYDSGNYIKGDIPAGEYAFVSFEGSGKYYVEKDSGGNIIDNENFDSFGYVHVHEAGNLETKGVLISVDAFDELEVSGAKEIYETLNNVEDFKDAGYYKAGLDIDPGQYVMESYGRGYVAVMTGPVGKSNIVDNENFEGRYSVNLGDGQYLKVSRASISE
ncbi:hypothetical protein [Bacillus sp. B15-48]|uniref:hypothetical protein n=1 Tax=Bacillus sp. B15-48 TaxID=1548601 RepID=UPI00193FFC18|nr:hypothetical protein [Bacillus sp. B15-48]MBM4762944.1 hypothetical protein [Bacillus sp. B15-48]